MNFYALFKMAVKVLYKSIIGNLINIILIKNNCINCILVHNKERQESAILIYQCTMQQLF